MLKGRKKENQVQRGKEGRDEDGSREGDRPSQGASSTGIYVRGKDRGAEKRKGRMAQYDQGRKERALRIRLVNLTEFLGGGKRGQQWSRKVRRRAEIGNRDSRTKKQ